MLSDDLQVQLDTMLDKLSQNQVKFRQARQHHDTDKDALLEVGMSRTTLSRWKANEEFMEAYYIVSTFADNVTVDLRVDPDADLPTIARDQLRTMGANLPKVVRRLFEIAMAGKDNDSLRAIDMIANYIGLSPEMLKDDERTNIQRTIINWTQININRGDDDGDTGGKGDGVTVEGEYSEMPALPEPDSA